MPYASSPATRFVHRGADCGQMTGILFSIAFLLTGKVTISNDGATIMKLLDIVHPAGKTLVDIAQSQDAEVCQELC